MSQLSRNTFLNFVNKAGHIRVTINHYWLKFSKRITRSKLEAIAWFYEHLSGTKTRRWVEAIFLIVSLTLLFPIIEKHLICLALLLMPFVFEQSSYVRYFIVFLCSILISCVLRRLGSFSPSYTLTTMLRYPPIWAIAIAGALVFGIQAVVTHHIPMSRVCFVFLYETLPLIVATLGGSLIVLVVAEVDTHKLTKTNKKKLKYKCAAGKSKELEKGELRLLNWVMKESPIECTKEDRFSQRVQANRITTLILTESPASIGIVGPFGSGKSSLVKLIEIKLSREKEKKHVVCKIDGWGRARGSVSQHILALSIEKVSQHIDCMSILTLPENYRQAIGEVKAPTGAIIASLLQVSRDPIAQLTRLDNLLCVAGVRLVIILEDLDRNVGDKILKEEIPSLLDRLHDLHHVTFILAIGTEKNYSNILVRICDYMEAVA